jgi:hypothetical protein
LQILDTNNMWLVAGTWMLLAAVSAFVAIRIKMPAALIEATAIAQALFKPVEEPEEMEAEVP